MAETPLPDASSPPTHVFSVTYSSRDGTKIKSLPKPVTSRKPLPSIIPDVGIRMQGTPLSPVRINHPQDTSQFQASAAEFETVTPALGYRNPSQAISTATSPPPPTPPPHLDLPVRQRPPSDSSNGPMLSPLSLDAPPDQEYNFESRVGNEKAKSRHFSAGSVESQPVELQPQLQYLHNIDETNEAQKLKNRQSRATVQSSTSDSSLSPTDRNRLSVAPAQRRGSANSLQRPISTYSQFSLADSRGRSPQLSPTNYARGSSAHSRPSPEQRPLSYIDLLNVPYPQAPPAAVNLDHSHLRSAVGNSASLLSTTKTLEMYRANVKKTNDNAVQYEFAIFMVNAAQEAGDTGLPNEEGKPTPGNSRDELLREARHILQKLSDRGYPFAQYYLGDGYASGLFSKGKEDYDRAFPLFVAASKHGHAESGYRAALCYEFGWGCRKDPAKAEQFYRAAASRNHPGAMLRLGRACLLGDMGLTNRYREGVKWMKRAAESADFQYNSAPYELGLLHETGYGDDVFKDEAYAAQLFTKSADLGHPEASYRMGDAYEHGKLGCPRDPGLSVHFYNGAAQLGHPMAMMALCAWYMVGAEPVLEKDENEAFEWAKKAAETGLVKAQYAVGYFSEMGIGCRRDPLEANAWYVKAADQGDERAKHRLTAIRAAASGGSTEPTSGGKGKKHGNTHNGEEKGKTKRFGIF
ncbi:MAG: hypothetical protein M1834_002793 [Cirrosporium novae-zelandiae]|nr:MAG: hypothetical protein M1834_002793 [Cirrosporium novae-zelandiae]